MDSTPLISMEQYNMSVYEPPKAKRWQSAERWQLGLWDRKYSLSGLRMFWCLIGTKWVYLSAPVCQTKIKMSRKEWDSNKSKERYHTEEDIRIYREKRKQIWDIAEKQRKEIEAGTYTKPKRKYNKKKQ